MRQSMEVQDTKERDYLDRLITETEAARFLNFSISTLRNWRVSGRGPEYLKVSQSSVRYRRRDLILWCEGLKKSHTSN